MGLLRGVSLFILFFIASGHCDNVSNIITNITIKTNQFSSVIFWDGIINATAGARISLYRTTNKITNVIDLSLLPVYKELTNEYFFEDPDIKFGIPYYYIVIVNGNLVLLTGNGNADPVFFGSTNIAIHIYDEELSFTNETYRDFIKKFNY
jgi:hypothetical protein